MKEVFKDVESNMKHAVDHFHQELKHLRTGRATLALLDGITVEYYGTPMPINQLANLSVADASLIVAQPYDSSQIAAIERAIMKSDLGLNPSSDGKVIRIPVPSLTEERRKEIVKKAHDMAEHARNAVRQVRREGNDGRRSGDRDPVAGAQRGARRTDHCPEPDSRRTRGNETENTAAADRERRCAQS